MNSQPASEPPDHSPHPPHTSHPPTGNGHRPLIGRPQLGTSPSAEAVTIGGLSAHLDRAQRRITLCGELDAGAAPAVVDALAMLPDTGQSDITIDLAGVSFIDAAGVSCLADCAKHRADRGAKVNLVGASARLRRVFDLVQLDALLQES